MKNSKKVLIGLLVVFVLIQFIKPEKNISAEAKNPITDSFAVSNDLADILKTSCYDCHSNNTVYPWYSNIQPVAWYLNDHVEEGKEELNFDEFTSYAPRRQFKKFEEIAEQIKEDEMPITSFTLIHRNAKLSEEQKKLVMDWCDQMRAEMKSKYTPDQLKRPQRKKPENE